MRENVAFERNMTGSFMKILPGPDISELDEKILMRNQIKGLLPMDQCILDGKQEYWYSITGGLSLESYLTLHPLDSKMLSLFMCSLAEVVDRMEHFLLDGNCLELSPEMIFIRTGNEIRFAAIPESGQELMQKMRSLMEFLLTKVDHSDQRMVEMSYGIYEMIMDGEATLAELKEYTCRKSVETPPSEKAGLALLEDESMEEEIEAERSETKQSETKRSRETVSDLFGNLVTDQPSRSSFTYKLHLPERKVRENTNTYKGFFSRIVQAFRDEFVQDYDADMKMLIEPEEEPPVIRAAVNPTVCLAMEEVEADGVLVSEGGIFDNLPVGSGSQLIGSGEMAQLRIPKETVSAIHARIAKERSDFILEDMNSTNGTYINGDILNYQEKRKLQKGDLIRFADVRYRFM